MLALRGLHWPTEGVPSYVADLALALVVGLALALAVGSIVPFLMRRRHAVRKAALDALRQMSGLPRGERAVAQARLLRRLVLTLHGETAARRQGNAWLEQLDRTFRTDFFTHSGGRYYVDGLYRDEESFDAAAVERELAKLFQRIRR